MSAAKYSAEDSAGEEDTTKIPIDWVPIGKVAKSLSCSHRTLLRRVQAGDLDARQDDTGNWWFDPEVLAEVVGTAENGAAAILASAAQLLAQIQRHNETLLEPNRKILELLVNDKTADRTRIAELEAHVAEQHKAAEKALSEENERMLARQQFEEEQRRLNRALDFLQSFQPLVMAYVSKHFGLPDTGEAAAISSFLATFSEDDVLGMVSHLPQEKAVVVLGIFEQIRARTKGKATDGTQGNNNGTSAGTTGATT